MFTAYFDESGTHASSRAIIVSGWVASNQQWIDFGRAWQDTLADHGLARFHMADFAQSKREFARWKGDESRREGFLRRLIQILRKFTRRSFSSAVIIDDYEEVNKKYRLIETLGPPYALCGVTCVKKVNDWRAEHGYLDPVLSIFEDGAQYKGKLLTNVERWDFPEPFLKPRFGTKDEYVALQAADLIAWEHRKLYHGLESGESRRFRGSFMALSAMPKDWSVFTNKQNYLESLCEKFAIPIRR